VGPVPRRAGPTTPAARSPRSAERPPPATATPSRCGSACGAARRWPHSGPALLRLPFWSANCGRRSAARKAAACAAASGLRLANFSRTALPCGSLGNLRARTLRSTALIPAHNRITRRHTRTGGNTHPKPSAMLIRRNRSRFGRRIHDTEFDPVRKTATHHLTILDDSELALSKRKCSASDCRS
jgi:hypothetical protein